VTAAGRIPKQDIVREYKVGIHLSSVLKSSKREMEMEKHIILPLRLDIRGVRKNRIPFFHAIYQKTILDSDYTCSSRAEPHILFGTVAAVSWPFLRYFYDRKNLSELPLRFNLF
jgi:hypothetical protein